MRVNMAIKNEGKYRIITAVHSFHGRTMMTVTATGQPKYQQGYEPLPAGFDYVPYGDLEALREAMDEDVCCVLLEPIQGKAAFMFPVIHTCMKQDYCAINMTHCLF